MTAHGWYHTALVHTYGDGETDEYVDGEATIVFNEDGTISASGADSDVFTDYFVNPTFEITDDKFAIIMSDEDGAESMLGIPVLEFDIVTLTDETFEVTGTFTAWEEEVSLSMTFSK